MRKVAENEWKAKYQGHYGLYNIRLTIDGEKAVKYYCSCPSCYHPCKHIGIIENAIASQAADENRGKQDRLQMVE
ncbi:MAG: SWIM zinc finger family protein, partial [Treponema sp.]|nr:SWIM zinc finger family protein [Treponema sp.]